MSPEHLMVLHITCQFVRTHAGNAVYCNSVRPELQLLLFILRLILFGFL